MADVFWTTPIPANWDDNVLGATPWGTSSGANDNAPNPVNGDRVFFDGNSAGALSSGPAAPVSLATLDMTGMPPISIGSLANITIVGGGTLVCTQATIFDGTMATNSTGSFADSSQFSGVGDGVSTTFNDTSTNASGASYFGTNTVVFNSGSTNACASFGGTGNLITFAGGSTSNVANITVTGTVVFSGNTLNTSGTITATAITVTGNLAGTGGSNGALAGPVAITGGTAIQVITGNVTITAGGTASVDTTGSITGNVSVSGSGSINHMPVSGNCTLSNDGGNTGVITGTLNVPYTTGAGKWGSFGGLNITGFKTPGVGGMPL